MPIEKVPSPSQRDTSTASEQLLSIRKVTEVTGYARSAITKNIAAGVFPPPVKPNRGKSSRWLASEIQSYIAAAVAARDRARSATLPT